MPKFWNFINKNIYKIILGLAIISSLIVLIQSFRYVSVLDYTYRIENSYRVFIGQIPYKDFFLVLTPGTYYITARMLKLFGDSNSYFVILCMLIQFLIIFLSFGILKKLTSNTKLILLSIIPLVFGMQTINPHPDYDVFCIILILFTIRISFLIEKKQNKSIYMYILIGIFASIPILFKQNLGIAFLFSYILVFTSICFKSKLKEYKKPLGIIIGSVLIFSGFGLRLYKHNIINDFVYQTFIFPSQERNIFKTLFDIFINIKLNKIVFYLPILFPSILILIGKIKPNLNIKGHVKTTLLVVGLFTSFFLIPLFGYFFMNINGHLIYCYQITIWYVIMFLLTLFFIKNIIYNQNKSNDLKFYLPLIILAIFGSGLITAKLPATWSLWPLFSFSLVLIWPRLEKNFKDIKRNIILKYLVFFITSFLCIFVFFVKPYIQLRSDKNKSLYISKLDNTKYIGTYGSTIQEMDDILLYIQKNIPKNDTFIEIPGEDPIYFGTKRVPVLKYFQLNSITLPYDGMYILEDIIKNKFLRIIHKKFLQGSQENINSGWDYSNDGISMITGYNILVNGIRERYGLYKSFKYYDIYKLK